MIEDRLVGDVIQAIAERRSKKSMSDIVSLPHEAGAPPSASAGIKHKGGAKTARIPIKVVAAERLQKPVVDTRARAIVAALLRDQAHPARAQPAHGVRGGILPEHRRVLRQRHGDVHDHGRALHAPLPVLRRRTRTPAAARYRGAAEPGRDHRGVEARVCRDHQRRSRRPARWRRAAFRRLHPCRARAFAGDADRGAGSRISAAASSARSTF